MNTDQYTEQNNPPIELTIADAGFDDVKAAFRAGLRDVTKRPGLSLFFGVFYALFGALLPSILAPRRMAHCLG